MSSTETTRDRVRGILGMAIYYTPGWDEQVDACTAADNVLRAFRELGLVVVDAGRFERVAGDAERWRKFAVTGLTPDGDFSTVRPGDLDPIPAPDAGDGREG